MDLDVKKLKLENGIKWVAGLGVVVLAGALALLVFTSLVAIVAAATAGLIAVNVVPVLARRLASWKVEQLRADAMQNPIPNLIRQYEAEQARVRALRQQVVKFNTAARNFSSKIQEYERRDADPEGLAEMRVVYDNMRRALAVQTEALAGQVEGLGEFRSELDKAQDKWNMAMDIHGANQATAGFTEQSPLERVLQRDAFAGITSRLNEGFAALETSLQIDYRALPTNLASVETVPLEQLNARLQKLEV